MSDSLSFSISRLSKLKEPGFRGCPELHPHYSCERREVEERLEAPAGKEGILGASAPLPELARVAPTLPVPAAGTAERICPPEEPEPPVGVRRSRLSGKCHLLSGFVTTEPSAEVQ